MKKLFVITFSVLAGVFLIGNGIAHALTPPLPIYQGGTGAGTFGQGWINSTGGITALSASTSPTVNYLTSTSTTATNAFAGKMTVGFPGPALYNFDVHGATTDSSLHFTGTGADSGGYITSAGVNNFYTSAGAAFQGNAWVAKTTDAAIIGAGNGGTAGQLSFFTNTGLTAGVSFAPTQRFAVGPGDYSIFGNTTSAGSASPYVLSLGGTYSTTCGANLKLKMYEDGGAVSGNYGFGICGGDLFTEVPTGAVATWDINGVEKMRLDTSGNLGIGDVAGNGAKLTIGGITGASGNQTLFGYSTNGDNYFTTGASGIQVFRQGGSEIARFDGSGRLGIATATPAQKLDVYGNASIGSTAQVTISTWHGAGDAVWIQLPCSGPSGIGFSAPGVAPALACVKTNGDYFAGSLAGDNAYRNISGQLLFGISTGAANLTMTTSGYLNEKAARYTANTGYQGIINAYSTDTLGAGIGGGLILGGTYTAGSQTEFGEIVGAKENATDGNYSGDVLFLTRNNGVAALTENMRIQGSTGFVGIGTTTPWGILSVTPSNTTGNTPQFVVSSSTMTSFVVTANGYVGISTTSPFLPFSIGSTTNSLGPNEFSVDNNGAPYFGGQPPLSVACTGGGTCTFDTYATDYSGTIATNGTVNDVTVSFKLFKPYAPHCVVSIGGTGAPGITWNIDNISSAGFKVKFSASIGTGFVTYFCPMGNP